MDVITTAGLTASSAPLGVEVVERKGAGHPDTLADGTAEAISRAYSRYCLETFGAILHHNTDKLSLLGGAADVRFGHGNLTAPVQVLVNGRITGALGDHTIPVDDIVTTAAKDYLARALPLLDVQQWVDVRTRLTQASSPGAVHDPGTAQREASRQRWFAPRSLDDLAERHRLFANDSSAGVGYWPLGIGEQLALDIEAHLTSEGFRAEHPYYGTDIKLMIVRHGGRVQVTACVPQIARETPDLDTYVARRSQVRDLIGELAARIAPGHHVDVFVNTRDVDERPELYLTATGSSIESGDEGVVGRGNRANGVISMFRPGPPKACRARTPSTTSASSTTWPQPRPRAGCTSRPGHVFSRDRKRPEVSCGGPWFLALACIAGAVVNSAVTASADLMADGLGIGGVEFAVEVEEGQAVDECIDRGRQRIGVRVGEGRADGAVDVLRDDSGRRDTFFAGRRVRRTSPGTGDLPDGWLTQAARYNWAVLHVGNADLAGRCQDDRAAARALRAAGRSGHLGGPRISVGAAPSSPGCDVARD